MFYTSFIRPVLEYACPAWHNNLTADLCESLELVQKRAHSIIFRMNVFCDYLQFCTSNGLKTLFQCSEKLCGQFFNRHVLPDSSCLHYLLPSSKDNRTLSRLRKKPLYNIISTHTSRFHDSFILHPLRNCVQLIYPLCVRKLTLIIDFNIYCTFVYVCMFQCILFSCIWLLYSNKCVYMCVYKYCTTCYCSNLTYGKNNRTMWNLATSIEFSLTVPRMKHFVISHL